MFIFVITESVAYEWGSKGKGLIRYFYDEQKHPSTKVDVISLGFITPLENAILLRVDSETTMDYLDVDIVRKIVF
jgi:leucine-rich repeat transmembrane neuronal protein 1/2